MCLILIALQLKIFVNLINTRSKCKAEDMQWLFHNLGWIAAWQHLLKAHGLMAHNLLDMNSGSLFVVSSRILRCC